MAYPTDIKIEEIFRETTEKFLGIKNSVEGLEQRIKELQSRLDRLEKAKLNEQTMAETSPIEKKRVLKCYQCRQEIYFEPNRKSKNGKSIPLDPATGESHDCPKSKQGSKKNIRSKYAPREYKSFSQEIKEVEDRDREYIRRYHNLK